MEAAVAVIRDMTRLHQLESEVRRGETLAAVGRWRWAWPTRSAIRSAPSAARCSSCSASWATRRAGASTPTCCSRRWTGSTASSRCCSTSGARCTLRLVPLNLHQLLERVALLSEEMAAQRGVQIVRRYDPSLPPDPGRRGPHACRSSTIWCATPSRRCPGRPPHAGHAAQHEPALRQGGPRRTASAAWPRSRWSTRARASRRPLRAKLFTPVLHHQGQGPRASGWPSATASSRSTGARSRSRASPAAAPPCPASCPDRAPIREGRCRHGRRTHPDRRRRGRPPLGAREGLPRRRLPGDRGEGRHRRAPRGGGAGLRPDAARRPHARHGRPHPARAAPRRGGRTRRSSS